MNYRTFLIVGQEAIDIPKATDIFRVIQPFPKEAIVQNGKSEEVKDFDFPFLENQLDKIVRGKIQALTIRLDAKQTDISCVVKYFSPARDSIREFEIRELFRAYGVGGAWERWMPCEKFHQEKPFVFPAFFSLSDLLLAAIGWHQHIHQQCREESILATRIIKKLQYYANLLRGF